ncbi:beta-ketoacyl-ACP synthase II [Hathewaya histolytica]|uniref:3-oxoacyl-[acyl-carrier-protein] synthase 2 n=1 Tax=Hathewaya histolytica TaxID=1498 RepID=A0A4U9S3P7_HATHI|nr:beta-ketoacyl-ACP synthase II [Hathewaya histolytica]VTQ96300.1 beta-ketoacyl synthase-like protein [Hathewaya histolytica]
MSNRVVVTGMGAITPIGNNVEEFWDSAKIGKCGIDKITHFSLDKHKVSLAGEIKNLDLEKYMDRRDAKRMDRYCKLAMIAAEEAINMSKLDLNIVDKDRFGVIVSSGIGGLETIENENEKLLSKGPNRVSPMMIPMIISNMAAGNIAIKYGAKGICTSIVTACATGTNSIGEAFRAIKYNNADIMITGGSEASITPLAIAGFANLTALNTTEDKERASIPFDKERNGFVMGEGAGVLILESLEHAKKRDAKIYGEIIGYGANCDAYHITSPSPDGAGAAKCMALAIKEGKINKDEVSYINAHGTSTPYNDKFETTAIKKLFGHKSYKIPINSTKSMVGHLLGAAGAVESIVCIKSLEEGFIHPTIGLKVPDEECDLDYVSLKGRKVNIKYALSNSLGFGGHNATLLFKKWEGR